MRDHWNRRQVLRHLGATGIVIGSSSMVSTPARGARPNDRLNLAIVGCGGQGAENLDKVAGENIVALCDVDEKRAADAFQRYPKAKRFRDYRKMLDALHHQIDAVVVSIPDHMHAPVSLAAMELGKHVYCEKPLTWSIDEVRRMASLASEKKLATQMGTQGMAGDGARAGIEVIRSGVLGDVMELHVWTDRPIGFWPQGIDRPRDTPPVPRQPRLEPLAGCGARSPVSSCLLPVHLARMEGFRHRRRRRHGNPQRGHAVRRAPARTAGDGGDPRDIRAQARDISRLVAAQARIPSRRWPRADHAVLVRRRDKNRRRTWSAAASSPTTARSSWAQKERSRPWSGLAEIGRCLPADRFRDFKPPQPSQPRAPGQSHHQEWLAACRGGAPAFCRFDGFASKLTETMLVANLALRTGRKRSSGMLEAMEAEGCPDASPFIKREYRAGW